MRGGEEVSPGCGGYSGSLGRPGLDRESRSPWSAARRKRMRRVSMVAAVVATLLMMAAGIVPARPSGRRRTEHDNGHERGGQIEGPAGDDDLYGLGGADEIFGNRGDDIYGGNGRDTISAGRGDD